MNKKKTPSAGIRKDLTNISSSLLGGIKGAKPPLDTSDPWPKSPPPPKDPKDGGSWRFWEWVILVDRAVNLEPDAVRRIQREIRKVVYAELANADQVGSLDIDVIEGRSNSITIKVK
jgi:hypothetical protein